MQAINLKINNTEVNMNDPVLTSTSGVALNWSITASAGIYQKYIEISIGTGLDGLGSNTFVGNLYYQNFQENTAHYFELKTAQPLIRSKVYYGQIRLRDNLGLDSDYAIFSFEINSFPFVTSAGYIPSLPILTEDFSIDYTLSKENSSARVLWYKNGELQSHLTDFLVIPRSGLRVGQSWHAEIIPYDGIDQGERISLPTVHLEQEIPVVDYIKIIPENPTENDMLSIEYSTVGSDTGAILKNDSENRITWYINGVESSDFNDYRSIRVDVKPGDRVRASVLPVYDERIGQPVSTEDVVIVSEDFRIRSLTVEGKVENLNVNAESPLLDWDVVSPFGREWKYTKVKVGTYWGADNLFSEVIETFDTNYRVPPGVVSPGGDYFVSVAASDDAESFKNFEYVHFRKKGSMWKNLADNSTGWAMRFIIKSLGSDTGGYYDLQISDGSRFFSLSLFPDKIRLNETDVGNLSQTIPSGVFFELIVSVKHDRISVYVDGEDLEFNIVNGELGDAKFKVDIPTSDRAVKLVPLSIMPGAGGAFSNSVSIREFDYFFDSTFEESRLSSYEMSFVRHLSFPDKSIDFLDFVDGEYVASINPIDSNKSGQIIKIDPSASAVVSATKCLDEKGMFVNSIIQSPFGNKVVFDHSQGASIMSGSIIPIYDVDTYFNRGDTLLDDNWDIVDTSDIASFSYVDNGFLIDTTSRNIGRYGDAITPGVDLNKSLVLKVRMIDGGPFGGVIFHEFRFSDDKIVIYLREEFGDYLNFVSVDARGKTIAEFANEIRSTLISSANVYFSDYYEIEVIDGYLGNDATILSNSDSWSRILSQSDAVNFYAEFGNAISDELDPDPYSYVSGGKCFFSHSKPGSNWFDYVDSGTGYTVDVELFIDRVEDSRRPVGSDVEDGFGVSFNDGNYSEVVEFRDSEILLKTPNKSVPFDFSKKIDFRFTGVDGKLKIFAKREGESNHTLVSNSPMNSLASGQASGLSPCIVRDSRGISHSVWHDDSRGGRGILWYSYLINGEWSYAEKIAESAFGFRNASIDVDSKDNLHVVFESSGSDYADIAYLLKNEFGWSSISVIVSETNNSSNPSISIDEDDNIHVAWQDNSRDQYDIYYTSRDGTTGQWSSGVFGGSNIQLSSSEGGAYHPDIVSNNNLVFVLWSEFTSFGTSHIKAARLDRNNGVWQSSAIDGVDFQVDSISNVSSDYPNTTIGSDGSLSVVWHDIIDGNYEIFWRKVSASLVGISEVIQLTSTNKSSRHPKISRNKDDGSLFVIFQRGNVEILDPSSPGGVDQSPIDQGSILCCSIYNSVDRKWRSSNSNDYSNSFDYEINFYNDRDVFYPNTSKTFSGNIPIVYSAVVSHPHEDRISQRDIFNNIYFSSLNNDLDENYKVKVGNDPYVLDDMTVSGFLPRKELRVGDFSNSISGRMKVGYIRYSTSVCSEPFSIRLINPSTSNTSGKFISHLINDSGDMWVSSGSDIEFYDFNKNSFFRLTSDDLLPETGLPTLPDDGSEFSNIFTDRDGVMFVIADGDGVYMSSDHLHFHKLSFAGISETHPIEAAFDKNNNLILVYEDSIYIVYEIERYSLGIPDGDGGTTITVISEDIKKVVDNISVNSYPTGKIQVDDLNVVWIPFKHGLLKISNSDIVLYDKRDGINGGKVLSVSIKSSSHRYICCRSAMYEMIGDHIFKFNLRNSEVAPVSLGEQNSQVAYSPEFVSNNYAIWTVGGSLLISSMSDVMQLTYLDENFNTKKIGIVKFKSSDYSLVSEVDSHSPRQNFSIEDYDSLYEYRNFFNVMINGHRISNGYIFNPFNTEVMFDCPVLPSDLIEVEIQPGIIESDDFSPNVAETLALGSIIRRPKKLEFRDSVRKAIAIEGTSGAVFIDDVITQRPFGAITLDREPPQGKLLINRVVAPHVLNLSIERLVEGGIPIPYDRSSGIDKMIVSNFDNFTSDGVTPLEAVPFKSDINHEVGDFLNSASLVKEFESETGSSLTLFKSSSDIKEEMYFSTSDPPSIYKKGGIDGEDESISLIYVFEDELEGSSITFLTVFQNYLIVAIGHPDGIGKLYRSRNAQDFTLVGAVSQNYISDFAKSPYDQLLYLSAGNDGADGTGGVYSYDGSALNLYQEDLSQTANSIIAFDRFLYVASGHSGIIYRLDVASDMMEIVHVDSSSNVLSIGNMGVIVYAGMEDSGTIVRSSGVSSHFVNSFRTVSSSVNKIKLIKDVDSGGDAVEIIYASVDNNLFKFTNAWTSIAMSTSTIRDFSRDSDGILWIVSDDTIQKVVDTYGGETYVYLKLIDKAGNQTSLTSDPDVDGDGYNDNLVAALDIETLRDFTNANRILELDEMGEVIFDYDGDAVFYSANRVIKEVGVFYTEVFNATNNHVAWDKISWESSVPENTDIRFYIRVGTDRDELLEADFDLSLNNSDSGYNITFLNGQFLQVKAVLITYERDVSPSLYKINVTSFSVESSHLFTTNFLLPSRVKRGILTADRTIPVSADIIFGISTNNSTEFNDYQVISENRLFTTESDQIGSGLRIGVRMLSPQTIGDTEAPPVEYGPYGHSLDVNTVEINYINTETYARTINFSVSFYNDAEFASPLASYSSVTNSGSFKINGDSFPEGEGYGIQPGETIYISFIPPAGNLFFCDKEYFTKIGVIEESYETIISDERGFLYQCGVSFVDNIQFDFQNLGEIHIYDFRVKFYLNEDRTNLFKSYFSGNNPEDWFIGGTPFPSDGETFLSGETKTIEFTPPLATDEFESGRTYFLSIDAFDGESFISQNNSYTYRSRIIADEHECGPYSGVPILRSFAIMFELEDGEFVKFNVIE